MGYTKTVWNEKSVPGISGAKLNKIEQGIYEAHERIANMQEIPSGGTSADAALYDINIGFDGTNHGAPGDSVRAQAQQLDDKINEVSGQLSSEIANVDNSIKKEINRPNVFDRESAYVGRYANLQLNGGLVRSESETTENVNLITSPIMEVKSGDVVNVRMLHSGVARFAFANENYVITQIHSTESGKTDYSFLAPNDAKYMQFCCQSKSGEWYDTVMVAVNTELRDSYYPYMSIDMPNFYQVNKNKEDIEAIKTSSELSVNPWSGKVCATLGTSLSANGGWSDVLKERFGFAEMHNRGNGGTTLANFSSYGISGYVATSLVYSDTENYTEERDSVFASGESDRPTKNVDSWYSSQGRIDLLPTNADLVIVDLCTNDFYRSWNVEDVNTEEFTKDTTIKTVYQQSINPYAYDDKYYCDAFMLMIKKIKARCPKAKIVVWGMLYNATITTENGSFDYYIKLIDLTEKMCRNNGIYFIDSFKEMGVDVYNMNEYIEDGVHPYKSTYATEKGKYAVANVLTSHLRNIYPKDYGVN